MRILARRWSRFDPDGAERLAEAGATLEEFEPLVSPKAFEAAQAAIASGDVLAAERQFVAIADTLGRIRERLDEKGARAAKLQPQSWCYAQHAGELAQRMGDYRTAASYDEAVLERVKARFGRDAEETAAAMNNLALSYRFLARFDQAEALYRRAIAILRRSLGPGHPNTKTDEANYERFMDLRAKAR